MEDQLGKGGRAMERWKALSLLVGRILLVLVVLYSGVGKMINFSGTAQGMVYFGLPMPAFFVIGAIIFELIGSLAIILGYYTRFGAILLAIYLIVTSIVFYSGFSSVPMQNIFMRNISTLGGCLALLASGPGRYSFDNPIRNEKIE